MRRKHYSLLIIVPAVISGVLLAGSHPQSSEDPVLYDPIPEGRISAPYGWQEHPITGERVWHGAIDIAAPLGTPILAAADGVIELATNSFQMGENFGTVVVIRHTGILRTFYAHLDGLNVEIGQKVTNGQQIGTVGQSGKTTGPHLHYEVWKQENPWYHRIRR